MKKTVLAVTALALASAATLALAAPEGRGHGPMFERLRAADSNADGLISRSEAASLPRLADRFDAIDANRDGQVSFEELRAYRQANRGAGFVRHLDANGDGKVSRDEALAAAAARFDRADADRDGFVTLDEMQRARHALGPGK